jgi:hypothetical protein
MLEVSEDCDEFRGEPLSTELDDALAAKDSRSLTLQPVAAKHCASPPLLLQCSRASS